AIRPRRARADGRARHGQHSHLGRGPRVHLVFERRLLRAKSRQDKRRDRRRAGSAQIRRGLSAPGEGARPGRRARRAAPQSRDRDAAVERMLNKVSLVTIWVEPSSYQIVQYTFDNVNLEFLPAAWLVHMDSAKAVMTMSQPMPDVWLPRDVTMRVSGTLAV